MGAMLSGRPTESDVINDERVQNPPAEEFLPSIQSGGCKRKLETDDVLSACLSTEFDTPRKKMKTTSDYIYNTLFVNGENSDVIIHTPTIEKSWNLHKIYLCQSPYFRSMFKGEWIETKKSEITIDIPDELITEEALNIAFGSLYSYEVDIQRLNINLLGVLASSRMFQLDGLLQHCEDCMLDIISADNVCRYHDAARRYGLQTVEKSCLNWLERNLLLCRTSVLAKELSKSLLLELLDSPDFVVMQVEMDIYNFLKIWLFLQIHPTANFSLKDLVGEAQRFFQLRGKSKNSECFLDTPDGEEFAEVFQKLRLKTMIRDLKCINLLERDSIIPSDWLLPMYQQQWKKMLTVYTADDTGPSEDLSIELFEENACRYGRTLTTDTRYCWRWTGFSYGVDIIVTYTSRTKTLSIKRNTFSQHCAFAVCVQNQRAVALKVKAFTLNEQGREVCCQDTGLLIWNFRTDEEIQILTFDDTWVFPIYISARLLLTNVNDV